MPRPHIVRRIAHLAEHYISRTSTSGITFHVEPLHITYIHVDGVVHTKRSGSSFRSIRRSFLQAIIANVKRFTCIPLIAIVMNVRTIGKFFQTTCIIHKIDERRQATLQKRPKMISKILVDVELTYKTTFSSTILLVDGTLCEGSSLLRLSSITSLSELPMATCAGCVRDAFTCLVFIKGGLRDWGNANPRLRAPRGGDGGG